MEEVIQTRRIEIVDSAGKVRAVLGIRIPDIGPMPSSEGPFCAFLTPAGRELVTFELEDNGREIGGYAPVLRMKSENEEYLVTAMCDNEAAIVQVGQRELSQARMLVCDGDVRVETSPYKPIEGVEARAA